MLATNAFILRLIPVLHQDEALFLKAIGCDEPTLMFCQEEPID
jgi:hypothetical protein